MKRHDDGHWEATVDLAPGRYEYKFVRDGEWIPDLLARENVWNQHGTLNSVIEVRA
jgi:1,4-alpha-glucan branching enzyme